VADVFLRFMPEDRNEAEQLAVALEQAGVRTCRDRDNVLIPSDGKTSETAYESAKCVVELWSSDSCFDDEDNSDLIQLFDNLWVDEEKNGRTIHVVLDGNLPLSTVPGHLVTRRHDLSHWKGDPHDEAFQSLLTAIRHQIALPAFPFNHSPDTHKPPERTMLFLCYRREDTQDAAARLHDRLADAYGYDSVFLDIASVPLGVDFVEHVTEQICRCSAVVVMIGRQWLTLQDKRGNRRLDDLEDLVRVEIATALSQKILVIPVLVQNASMPDREDLPDDLRLLTRRNGIALRHDQWREGVARLLKELDPVMRKK
jgi:hypothetical protein